MARGELLRVALSSARELDRVIDLMDEEELQQALELESGTSRRPVLLERMVRRLTRLIEIRTREELRRVYTPWLLEENNGT